MLQSYPCPIIFCKLGRLDSVISDISPLCNILCSKVGCRRKTPKLNQSFIMSLIMPPFIKKFSMNVAGHLQPSHVQKRGLKGRGAGRVSSLKYEIWLTRTIWGGKSWGRKKYHPSTPAFFHLSRHPRLESDRQSDTVLRGQKINVWWIGHW